MSDGVPSFERAQERLTAIVGSLQEQNESLQQEFKAAAADAARAQEELAIANRRGERGRNWQILQSRMDLDQTSMDAIMNGADTSAEARRVRTLLNKNFERLNEEIQCGTKDNPDEEDPRAEAQELLDDLHKRVEEFKQRFGTL